MKYFLIDEEQLKALRRAATRLYAEQRMDGDVMRDMGHVLSTVAAVCEELDVTEFVDKGNWTYTPRQP